MGAEIKNTQIILLSVMIFFAFLVAYLVIAVTGPEEKKEQEIAVTVSAPQKIQQTNSGQIAGLSEEPTVINISSISNSSNETE